jgi:hypothetical protein
MPWARKSPSARVHPISVLFWTAVCPDSGFPWRYAVRAGVRRDGPPVCFSWQRLLGFAPVLSLRESSRCERGTKKQYSGAREQDMKARTALAARTWTSMTLP